MKYLDYILYYQPEGTVEKYMEFNAENDEQAILIVEDFCNKTNSKLIRLERIEIKVILGGTNNEGV